MRKVLYFLGQLTDQDADWIASAGRRRRVPVGTTVIDQGRPTKHMSILLDGALSVELRGIGEVAQLGCGEIVGEMSLIDHQLPSATVKAASDCMILDLPQDALARKLEQDLGFSARFHKAAARFLSDRLRATMRRMAGERGGPQDADDDEMDLELLGDIHLAGARFDAMVKRLMGL